MLEINQLNENHQALFMKTDSVTFCCQRNIQSRNAINAERDKLKTWRNIMWTKPAATEMRFGFEVTMYLMNK